MEASDLQKLESEVTEVKAALESAQYGHPSSRYKHIYAFINLLFSSFIVVVQYSLIASFGRWVWYRILKRYRNQGGAETNRRSYEIVRLVVKEEIGGGLSGLWDSVLLSFVPFFKNTLNTLAKREKKNPTQFLHSNMLWRWETNTFRDGRQSQRWSVLLPFPHLCQLLCFVVKRVHNFAHVLNRFQSCFICFVHWRFFKDDQHTLTLVEDSWRRGDTFHSQTKHISDIYGNETERNELPWNFLSRIIWDNFLSTSPFDKTQIKTSLWLEQSSSLSR